MKKIKENITIEFRCNKCGKEQEPDEKQSNQNWKAYPANEKCKCGGIYEVIVK